MTSFILGFIAALAIVYIFSRIRKTPVRQSAPEPAPEKQSPPEIRLPKPVNHQPHVQTPPDNGLQITSEFEKVKDLLDSGTPCVFVTGGAGTGKTTLIGWLCYCGCIDAIVAPTGAAAVNCHGSTIHSFFGLPRQNIKPIAPGFRLPSQEKQLIIEKMNTLVIDEISMVRADVLDAIDWCCRTIRNNSRPFGGLQLLLVGDPFQLPPIVPKPQKHFFDSSDSRHQWRSEWFFDSHAISSHPLKTVILTHVFRQNPDELEYISHLNNLRTYKNISAALDYFNAHCMTNQVNPNAITITTTKQVANAINAEKLSELPPPQYLSKAEVKGDFVKYLKTSGESLPAPEQLRLKKNALVMLLVNDREKRFVNGTAAIVLNVDNEKHMVTLLLETGKQIDCEPHTWESVDYIWNPETQSIETQITGSYRQYPMQLAWAITTHKSQGRTLNHAIINFEGGVFAPGQTYVALSRTRRIKDIKLLNPLTTASFRRNKRLVDWFSTEQKEA